MICPICNKELNPTDAFCPTCGYEIHIYPEGSDAFEALEKTRVNKYKEFWKAVDESKTTIQNLESECNDLKDTLSNMQEELNKMTVQAKDLSTHLSSAQYEISQLNSRLEEKQKQISQGKNTISDLTQQRDDYKEQLLRITKEKDVVDSQYRKLFEQMSSMQYEVSQLKDKVKSHQDNELVGIVSVKNNKSEALQYLPVYKGVNTYGAASGDGGNHHEIKVRVRGGGLRPRHFSVTIEKQAIIKPVDNAELMYYGVHVPAQGIAVVAQQGIIISDILELHISKI